MPRRISSSPTCSHCYCLDLGNITCDRMHRTTFTVKPREMDQDLRKLRRAKFGWISLAETQTKCLARLTFTTYMQANIEDAQDSSGVIQHWLKWIIFWLKDCTKNL